MQYAVGQQAVIIKVNLLWLLYSRRLGSRTVGSRGKKLTWVSSAPIR